MILNTRGVDASFLYMEISRTFTIFRVKISYKPSIKIIHKYSYTLGPNSSYSFN